MSDPTTTPMSIAGVDAEGKTSESVSGSEDSVASKKLKDDDDVKSGAEKKRSAEPVATGSGTSGDSKKSKEDSKSTSGHSKRSKEDSKSTSGDSKRSKEDVKSGDYKKSKEDSKSTSGDSKRSKEDSKSTSGDSKRSKEDGKSGDYKRSKEDVKSTSGDSKKSKESVKSGEDKKRSPEGSSKKEHKETSKEDAAVKRKRDEEVGHETKTKRPRVEETNKKSAEPSTSSKSKSQSSDKAKEEKPGKPEGKKDEIKFSSSVHPDLVTAYKLVYEPSSFFCTSKPVKEAESEEYAAFDFGLNGHLIKFRVAKITPTKNGQFVTLWKRDSKKGPIKPYDLSDKVEMFVVSVRDGSRAGQFLFPKNILAQRDIVSKGGKGGKRAMRVYPPWVKPESKQAATTQDWQQKYFLHVPEKNGQVDLSRARRLLSFLSSAVRKL